MSVVNKKCVRCEQVKPAAAFPSNRKMRYGLDSWCKECRSTYSRLRNQAKSGRVAEDGRWRRRERIDRDADGRVTSRTCPDCLRHQPIGAFPINAAMSTGHSTYCRPCHAERARLYTIRKKYGMTGGEHSALLESQGGLCFICRTRPAEHTDHDHATGEVRSLLCQHCNQGLGHFFDDPQLLIAAAAYVMGHGPTPLPADGPPERRRVPRETVPA